MISESVRRVLNEGHSDSSVYNKWQEVRQQLGDDTMLSELYNYLSGDDIEDFISNVIREWDLDYDEEDY